MNAKNSMKRRTKGLTWAEAAKVVLERHPQTPMNHKDIFRIIQREKLKDVSGGNAMLCLNSCMHANSRGRDGLFYKVAGCSGFYGLLNDLPDGSVLCELEEGADSTLKDVIGTDGQPAAGSQTSERPFADKRRDKVMYVKLPQERMPLLTLSSNLLNGSGSNSDTTVTGDEMMSEGISDAFSLDNDSAGNSMDGLSTEATSIVSDVSIPATPVETVRPKRKPRNDPLRHYKRSRKKRTRFTHIRSQLRKSVDNAKQPLLNYKRLSGEKNKKVNSATNPMTGVRRVKRQSFNDILAGIPGLNLKQNKIRSQKTAGSSSQVRKAKQGILDLESPNSALVDVNLRSLINSDTYALLPEAYQYQLAQLLPSCDRVLLSDSRLSIDPSALSNEFFSKACSEWRERLAEGEFTQETQQKIKNEEERLQQKIDPWKVKHFEPVWGARSLRSPPISLPSSPPPKTITPPKTINNTTMKECTVVLTNTEVKTLTTIASEKKNVLITPPRITPEIPPLLSENVPCQILDIPQVVNEEIVETNPVVSLAASPPKLFSVQCKTEPEPVINKTVAQLPLKRGPVYGVLDQEMTASVKKPRPLLATTVPPSVTFNSGPKLVSSGPKLVSSGPKLVSSGPKLVSTQRMLQPSKGFAPAQKRNILQAPRLPPQGKIMELPQRTVANSTTRFGPSIIQPSKFGASAFSSHSLLGCSTSLLGASTVRHSITSQSTAHSSKAQGRTRTLADIKAQNKAKREEQSRHIPPILQSPKRLDTFVSLGNQRTSQGVDLQRSQNIVNQAIQESQRNHAAAANVPTAIPSTLIIRTVNPTTASVARDPAVITRPALPANPTLPQQVFRVAPNSSAFNPQLSNPNLKTVSQVVQSQRAQQLPGSVSSQSNPRLAAALQQASVPPLNRNPVSTRIVLPNNIDPNEHVIKIEPQKNAQAAGGLTSLSTLSSNHQPQSRVSNDDNSSSILSTESQSFMKQDLVRKTSKPTQASASSSGTLPKIKFVRVTLPSGESQYILASKDDRHGKSNEINSNKTNAVNHTIVNVGHAKQIFTTKDGSKTLFEKSSLRGAALSSAQVVQQDKSSLYSVATTTKASSSAITTSSYTSSALLQALCGTSNASPVSKSSSVQSDIPGQGGRNNDSHSKACALKLCNLKAMEMCKKCGAFSHPECSGPSKLCVQCLLVTTVN